MTVSGRLITMNGRLCLALIHAQNIRVQQHLNLNCVDFVCKQAHRQVIGSVLLSVLAVLVTWHFAGSFPGWQAVTPPSLPAIRHTLAYNSISTECTIATQNHSIVRHKKNQRDRASSQYMCCLRLYLCIVPLHLFPWRSVARPVDSLANKCQSYQFHMLISP